MDPFHIYVHSKKLFVTFRCVKMSTLFLFLFKSSYSHFVAYFVHPATPCDEQKGAVRVVSDYGRRYAAVASSSLQPFSLQPLRSSLTFLLTHDKMAS